MCEHDVMTSALPAITVSRGRVRLIARCVIGVCESSAPQMGSQHQSTSASPMSASASAAVVVIGGGGGVVVGKPEAAVAAIANLPGQPQALVPAVVDVAVKPVVTPAASVVAAASAAPQQTTAQSLSNTLLALTAGGCAGALSRTCTSPLERLKVMKQIQSTGNAYAGTFQALAKMYREEGVRSYWKGNGTNVVRIAPYSAIQFWSFDHYKRWLMPPQGHEHTLSPTEHTVRLLTAGALAGATSSVSCYPLDLVRSVLTVQTDPNAVRRGLVGTLRAIYAAEGLKGCYRGLTPTLLGIAPYVAINFAVFDTLKTRFLPERTHPSFDLINLGLGACAGATAAALTYPSDVVRRRMQLQGLAMGGALPRYNGTWDCIATTVRHEGVRGLYKGLSACLLKVIPSVALSWATYERLKAWWKFAPPPKTVSAGS